MQSLGLKVCTDFLVGTCAKGSGSRNNPTRLVDFDVGTRKNWCCAMGNGDIVRSCKIVACSSQRNAGGESPGPGPGPGPGPSPVPGQGSVGPLSRTQTYVMLKQQMEVATKAEAEFIVVPMAPFGQKINFPLDYLLNLKHIVLREWQDKSRFIMKLRLPGNPEVEDYKEAARIRDSLKLFEEEEPVLRLRRLLKNAVAEERFEDAARYRDELKEIAPHSLLNCSSDATTLGIRVQVRSVFIEGRSQPSKGQYFFAYRIRITNNSDRPVQLLRRHWIITDGNGKTENVWGIGVIGEQPVILPKTGFEYSSACPLSTPNGRMEGDFEMKHIDKVGSRTFNVAIAPFLLSSLGEDSDPF